MIDHNRPCWQLAVFFAAVVFSSCNNSSDIPFPEKELGFSQPVTAPLQFTEPKKLHWDTAKKGGINPVVKQLDIETLPDTAYDASGFRPFIKQTEQTSFNYNSLPETAFDLEQLASVPLDLKTTVFPAPQSIKTLPPVLQAGEPLSIFDLGKTQHMPAKFVTCLFTDRHGLMWIASFEGIFRYSGEYIQEFVKGPFNNPVLGMAEDNSGKIWYITASGLARIDPTNSTRSISKKIMTGTNSPAKITKDERGYLWVFNNLEKAVSIVDPATETFKNLRQKNGLSDSSIFEMQEDRDKKIWVSTFTGGADIIDLKAGKIKHLRKASGLGNDTLTAMTMDSSGRIWLAQQGEGLDAVDTKLGTIKHYNLWQPQKNITFNLTFDNKGLLWKGTVKGLEIIDLQKEMARLVKVADGLYGDIVVSCSPDKYGRMWVGTTLGLHIITQNGATVYPMGNTPIITQMEDSTGHWWIGTDHGIEILDIKNNKRRRLDKSRGLADDFVQSFTKTDQQIWVTSNGGLDIIDPARKTLEHIGKQEGLVSDTIYSVFRDKYNNIWFTGPSNGIDRIDPEKKMILRTNVDGGLSDNNIQDIKEDDNGMIWLATRRGGVSIINLQTGSVKYLNDQPGLRDTCNRMMMKDRYGRIWIGTDRGIYIADIKLGTITNITAAQGLSSNRIVSLQEYNNSIIAGTNNKVHIITPAAYGTALNATDSTAKAWKIAALEKSEGLVRQQANAWNTDLVTSQGQFLWGDRGLAVINDISPAFDSIVTYITGMNVMTNPQAFLNPIKTGVTDTLWTADSFYIKGQTPPATGYQPIKGLSWDSVAGPYNMPADLHIPYDQNYIQFQFTQAHLGRQDTSWYSYILQGIDKNWSTPTTNLFTENYLNLSPGNYTFKVRCKGTDGKWGAPASFSFTISSPWYATWWAYTIFALACIVLLRAYIVYRSRMLQRENKLLEEKVNLRTSELQKSLEELKATQAQLIQSEKMASLGELTAGIAHEIQNPLNFVNNFSEVNTELIAEMKDEIDKGNLEDAKAIANDIAANEQKINQHGKRADSIVKGMLQHSRSSTGIKEPVNINALADEYLRLAYHGLRAKDKTFNATLKTDFDAGISNIQVIPQDIGRVILNLITNAFYAVTEKKKEGISGYDPTVSVSTKKTAGKIEIKVEDNGNGIPQKVLDKIFQPFFTTKPTGHGTGLGLSMSYDIVTKGHGGELSAETKEGQGAIFIIKLPAT